MTALEILHDRAARDCSCLIRFGQTQGKSRIISDEELAAGAIPCESCIAKRALIEIEGALIRAIEEAARLKHTLPKESPERARVFRFENALSIGAELCRRGEDISPADEDDEDKDDEDSTS